MRSITGIADEVTDYAATFDADAVTVTQARLVQEQAVRMERAAAALKAKCAARTAQSGSWREAGDRSPAHELARTTGVTVGQARETLQTGQQLAQLPELAQAASRGELSPQQTAAVAQVGAVAPDLVGQLMERAKETTVPQLREDCARALASRDRDAETRRQRIHADRSLRHWTTPAGVGVLHVEDTPEVIAGIVTDIAPAREALFTQARERGEHVRPDALDVDALTATVRAGRDGNGGDAANSARPPHRCAPRVKMLVRVDFDTLLRGYPIDGEVCEIAGYGPISVTAARDLMATGDPFLAAIVTRGRQVCGVAHLGRKALSYQASALEWLNPCCAADGCTQTARLEIDHRDPWSRTKVTMLDLLDRLCDHHHDLKTHSNWALTAGTGKRPFVPPTDPRHPQHTRQCSRGDPPAA
ncbi:MAG: HNH endonuclease [Frankiales bacterium]|nr:HNH endonuclease [Frankiales bacterium]